MTSQVTQMISTRHSVNHHRDRVKQAFRISGGMG